MAANAAAGPEAPAGAQTLARGLAALEMIAAAENGMTVQEMAERLGRAPDHRVPLARAPWPATG